MLTRRKPWNIKRAITRAIHRDATLRHASVTHGATEMTQVREKTRREREREIVREGGRKRGLHKRRRDGGLGMMGEKLRRGCKSTKGTERYTHTLRSVSLPPSPFFSTRRFNAMIKSALGKKWKAFWAPSGLDEARERDTAPTNLVCRHIVSSFVHDAPSSIPPALLIVAESSLKKKKKKKKKRWLLSILDQEDPRFDFVHPRWYLSSNTTIYKNNRNENQSATHTG